MDFYEITAKINALTLDARKKEVEAAAALTDARQAKEDAVKRQKKAIDDGKREAYIQATTDLQNAATALDFAQLTYNAAVNKPTMTSAELDALYGELLTAADEKYRAIAEDMIKALDEAKRLALGAEKLTAAFADAGGQVNRLRKDKNNNASPYFGKTAACIAHQLEARINAIRVNLK